MLRADVRGGAWQVFIWNKYPICTACITHVTIPQNRAFYLWGGDGSWHNEWETFKHLCRYICVLHWWFLFIQPLTVDAFVNDGKKRGGGETWRSLHLTSECKCCNHLVICWCVACNKQTKKSSCFRLAMTPTPLWSSTTTSLLLLPWQPWTRECASER